MNLPITDDFNGIISDFGEDNDTSRHTTITLHPAEATFIRNLLTGLKDSAPTAIWLANANKDPKRANYWELQEKLCSLILAKL